MYLVYVNRYIKTTYSVTSFILGKLTKEFFGQGGLSGGGGAFANAGVGLYGGNREVHTYREKKYKLRVSNSC